MDTVLRAAVVYAVLWLVFRIAGKRALAEITTFDFILLLIISETTQSALSGSDYSLTNSVLLIVTLVGMDVGLSLLKQYWPTVDKLIDGVPLVILENGRPLRDRMDKSRVDEADILAAARRSQGLERLDQIKYAVLERDGGISIIPMERS
jgi:uncharacterized membrane protein YcaP (DUF421 family)